MTERYTKTIADGYITQICAANLSEEIALENEITKAEYDQIADAIANAPEETGEYYWMLKEDLTWEKVMRPEPIEDDATEQDYRNALEMLGVDTNEEENA